MTAGLQTLHRSATTKCVLGDVSAAHSPHLIAASKMFHPRQNLLVGDLRMLLRPGWKEELSEHTLLAFNLGRRLGVASHRAVSDRFNLGRRLGAASHRAVSDRLNLGRRLGAASHRAVSDRFNLGRRLGAARHRAVSDRFNLGRRLGAASHRAVSDRHTNGCTTNVQLLSGLLSKITNFQ